jgi:hypothetical protein
MRKKAGIDDQVPALVESAVSSTAFRRNRARLIQKIYEIDPLLCRKCQGSMKIIAFIEDEALIKKILIHLGLCETGNHDPPHSIMRISKPLERSSPAITHTRNRRPSIIGPYKGLYNGSILSEDHKRYPCA